MKKLTCILAVMLMLCLCTIAYAAAPAFKRVWEHYGLGWFVDDVDEDTGGSGYQGIVYIRILEEQAA